MRQVFSIGAGAILLILLGPGTLLADTFGASCGNTTASATVSTQDSSGVVVDSNVNGGGPGICGASAGNTGVVNEVLDGQDFVFSQSAQTSASARASLGSLGAQASASASSTPASYTFDVNNEAQIVTDEFHAQAGSGASASWFDTFTNPNPDTLELQLHAVFDGSCSPQCLNGIPPFISGQTVATFQTGCSSPPNNPFANCLSDITVGPSTNVFLDPGAVVQVSASIDAQAAALSGDWSGTYIAPNSSSANAFNTLGFYITVIGDCTFRGCNAPSSGETYDTGSGHIYSQDALNATETPEPCSLLLLGSGLAGLAVWGRNNMKHGE